MIKKPLLAVVLKDEHLDNVEYPLIGSPKLDGIRCVVMNNKAHARSLKLIPNEYIQQCLGRPEYNGLDGEIVVGEANDPRAFLNTTGKVRKNSGRPDFKFYVFDDFTFKNSSYEERWVNSVMENIKEENLPFVVVVPQVFLWNKEELLAYEAECLKEGYEGIMVRSPHGIYKEGRSTLLQAICLKRKPMEDAEAVILECGEGKANKNETKINELGLMTRSTHQKNMIPNGTLGFFRVKCDLFPEPFTVGTGNGLTKELRKYIWENQEKFIGKTVKFKYQSYGSDKVPRLPILMGFREKFDMD